MSEVDELIKIRIEACRKYINPHNNPALVRSYDKEIRTLKSAPRTERELAGAIRRVKAEMHLTIDTADLESLSSELEALEWLLPIVKKYSGKNLP